ncbi:MAG: tetratricopeptide repeat protein [Acidobacteria bacterium]|nr:tetratricopeptide repeat protein [Acidobacteriota bacterium]
MRGALARRSRCALAFAVLLCAAAAARAQAPPAIQIFMPNGERPPRELRLQLTRDDGRIETVFTDSKGKFQFTGDLNGIHDYEVRIEGDGQTFDTTVTSLRFLRGQVSYVPVFLSPHKGPRLPPNEVVDAASFDADVPAAARAAYDRAMKAVGDGRAEEALGELKSAVAAYPKYARALNDLGVLYLKLDRLDEAAETLARAAKINRRFYFPRLNLGVVLNRQGKYAEAVEVLGRLYAESPTFSGLGPTYADALVGAGQSAKAKKVLNEALATADLSQAAQVEAHYKLGMILSREEDYAAAAAELEKADALDPGAANVHLLLGGAYMQLKRPAEAERELLRAYELGGAGVGNAQLLLGQLYLSQQKLEPARRALEQYLKDVPAAPNAAQVKETVEKIKEAVKKQ